jgi:hypothetical protein
VCDISPAAGASGISLDEELPEEEPRARRRVKPQTSGSGVGLPRFCWGFYASRSCKCVQDLVVWWGVQRVGW